MLEVSSKRSYDSINTEQRKQKKLAFNLPDDIISEINKFLHFQFYPAVNSVNRQWHQAISHSSYLKLNDFIFNSDQYIKSKNLILEKDCSYEKEIKSIINRFRKKLNIECVNSLIKNLFLQLNKSTHTDKIIHQVISFCPVDLKFFDQLNIVPQALVAEIQSIKKIAIDFYNTKNFDLSLEQLKMVSYYLKRGTYSISIPNYTFSLNTLFSNFAPYIFEAYKNTDNYLIQEAIFEILLQIELCEVEIINICKKTLKETYATNKNLLLKAINNPRLLEPKRFTTYINKWSQDYDIAMASVKKDGQKLQKFPKFNNWDEIVIAAIKQNGLALEFASQEIKNSEYIVDIAFKSSPFSLKYASLEMRKKQLNDTNRLKYCLNSDKSDLELIWHAIENRPDALWSLDDQNYSYIVSLDGRLLKYLPSHAQKNIFLVKIAEHNYPKL